jgi:hypothetical protein
MVDVLDSLARNYLLHLDETILALEGRDVSGRIKGSTRREEVGESA